MTNDIKEKNDDEKLNVVTFELIKGGFQSALKETASLMERAAMSAIMREKKDYFTAFFDAQGRLVAGMAHPIGANMMDCILEEFPVGEMKTGDIYMYNDCYRSQGGVSHLPDLVFSTPVIKDDKLVGFCTCFAHFVDIGGMAPGSYSAVATEVFQEGIIIPPVKLYDAGELNEYIVNILVRNSRFPKLVRGDMEAVLAATRLSAKRSGELCDRYGTASVMEAFAQMQNQTEAVVKKAYASLPDGSYTASDSLDGDPLTGESKTIEVTFEKSGDDIVIDLTNSSDQAKGPINFIMHDTAPQQMLGLYFISNDPTVMVNEGLFRSVKEVRIREGSILRPKFPAPLVMRAMTMVCAQQALMGTIALATDGNVSAGSPAYVIAFIRAHYPETGETKVIPEGVGVGYGARPFYDGHDAVYYVSQQNYPIEYLEMQHPVEIESYSLRADSGGPGRWRGGTGVIRDIKFLAPEGSALVRLGNVKFPPWGMKGGQGGRPGRVVLNPGTDREEILPTISDAIILKHGDVLRFETCGGGGWGNPFDREPERVQKDVSNGMVTLQGAADDYGVVLDAETLVIDEEATKTLRADSRPHFEMFHRWTDESLGGVA
ncbi:MAG: hydantoinase B/oxoprolinase family protein [Halioglobus sp.]